ncbi:hypothetical protein SUGI_0702330 [Cryptomeria japonica]|nr:hypothetical protein SUGI_0702330 [Cryptomeria japonica]
MKEALHLILSGSILCLSFITSSKWSKFVFTKSISEELVYLRGKVESMKIDILLRMNLLMMKSLTTQPSNQQNLTAQPQDSNDPENELLWSMIVCPAEFCNDFHDHMD